jgi:hypothetical protein
VGDIAAAAADRLLVFAALKENRISLITGISIIYVVIFYIIFVYLPMPYLDWVGTMPDLNGTEKIRPRSRY